MIITSTKKINQKILQELKDIYQGDSDPHAIAARLQIRITELKMGHSFGPERELLVERKAITSRVTARLMQESL